MSKKRVIHIVFEETGGQGFQVYLTGDKERLNSVKPGEMSPAEFWASKMMSVVIGLLREAGVIKTVTPQGENH